MSHHQLRLLLVALFFCGHLYALEGSEETKMTENVGYSLTHQADIDYNNCLIEFSHTKLDEKIDARVVADHAMKHCAPILGKLYDRLIEQGYPPEANRRMTTRISHRGANQLLITLMRVMATQQNQQVTE